MAKAPSTVTVECAACGTPIVLPRSVKLDPNRSVGGSMTATLRIDPRPLDAHMEACIGRHVQPSDIVTDEADAHIAACTKCQLRFPLVAEIIRHG